MTVDQSLTPFAPDRAEVSSRFEWLSAKEINTAQIGGALGEEPGNDADPGPGSLMPPPAFPAWPRVYPGL